MTGEGAITKIAGNSAIENLKVIKVLHQVLMAVTAAILAFALRPDLTHEYKQALDELVTLKQVSLGGWSNYVAQRYRRDSEQDAKFVMSVIHQAGLHVKGAPGIIFPVFAEQAPYSAGPYATGRLLDFDTFVSKTQKIGAMQLVAQREPLLEQLAKWSAARNPHVAIIALNLSINSGVQYPDGSPMLDWLNRPQSGTVSAPLYLVTDEQGAQPAYVNLTYSVRAESGPFALDWLRNDVFGRKLTDAKTGVVFPHLKTFWHQVNQDNVDQATVFLQEEMEANTRGTLSFFGIPVERSLAVSAGPVLSVCILLFLGLHLIHFRSLSIADEGVRNYPWVGLFRGWLAAATTYASLLALPALANISLIHRYGQADEWSSRIGTIAALLVVTLGSWVLFEVRQVRKQWPSARNGSGGTATVVSAPAAATIRSDNMDDEITSLSKRIQELGDKSTQLLTFLSFSIVVVAAMNSSQTLGPIEKHATRNAMWSFALALFPVILGIVPLKEFREGSLTWYRFIRMTKVVLLWVAAILIGYGIFQFTRVL
jgi:hypothetical protein